MPKEIHLGDNPFASASGQLAKEALRAGRLIADLTNGGAMILEAEADRRTWT
jgi:hypothetical protein